MLNLKYRPRIFEDIHGQPHAKLVLQRLASRVRAGAPLPPLLFAGPRGSGKTTSARILAAAIGCSGEAPPCGECDYCVSTFDFTNPDVVEVDGATSGGVESIRAIRDLAWVAPIRHRLFVIDEAHATSAAAQTALLKGLEEPPPLTSYILTTTEPDRISSPVRSRLIPIVFRSVPVEDIAARVASVAKEEGSEVPLDVLMTIAQRAEGSIRDALVILEQLSIVGEFTLSALDRITPGGLTEFARVYVESALSADLGRGLAAFTHAFNVHRDSRRLLDAIVRMLDQLAESRSVPLENVSAAVREVWRLHLVAKPGDPVVVRSAWYVVYHCLTNGGREVRLAAAVPDPEKALREELML